MTSFQDKVMAVRTDGTVLFALHQAVFQADPEICQMLQPGDLVRVTVEHDRIVSVEVL